ncbi:uncharacterized protein LOC106778617 isoform X1 [Vigna radiata var. radiata]|uniref:Uncharacterized protein LOC106778617 isoform X1 n=1 Tax=Vigna radiata var. radiata TaxID=3916 RepID=A0A1S3VVJ2_VIGRR|nr:uncharacterized protein LOC106778617 isoform X1 [Vigna radiata var. radiata]XP_014522084.1 uncharacterized protein LOC106778617 isoform X1 [Vigna radiata var. radiata]
MAMGVKCITWVGNMFQKFEDICVDVDDAMFEETVNYLGNQMQTVGESVKKICSEVMQDLRPLPSCDFDEISASELPINQNTDAGLAEKSFEGSRNITVNDGTKQTTEDSRISDDVDIDVIHAESCDSNTLFITASCYSLKGYNKSNLGGDKQDKSMSASKSACEITLSETDIHNTSQLCELSGINENHADTVSKPTSSESITIASLADCCNEIENTSTKEIIDDLEWAESTEGKEKHSSSYSCVLFVDPYEITETWDLDVPKIGTIAEQGHKTMQQDDELKLVETCVMVTRDELESVLNAEGNLRTSKNKKRQPFLLSKKAARRKEYEELAMFHGNNEKGEFAESSCPTLQNDHKKLLLPDISESEWEVL